MSKEHAKAFYDKLASDPAARAEAKAAWGQITALAKKHGYDFTHAEYFDVVHDETGMTRVGKSDDHDDTDTCITIIPSEPPGA